MVIKLTISWLEDLQVANIHLQWPQSFFGKSVLAGAKLARSDRIN